MSWPEHDLKVIQPYFEGLISRAKMFEVRWNDRGFQPQDTVLLREWTGDEYTGREVRRTITYVLRDAPAGFGIQPGFVVLSLAEVTS